MTEVMSTKLSKTLKLKSKTMLSHCSAKAAAGAAGCLPRKARLHHLHTCTADRNPPDARARDGKQQQSIMDTERS